MPNTSGSPKKYNNNEVGQKNNNNKIISPERSTGSAKNAAGSGSSSAGKSRARKRKRCEIAKHSDSDLESEFEDCDMKDAYAIEKKLRTIASTNNFSEDEMRRLLQKFVKNEHILALVTLKAEDELAREKREAEQERAVIITDTPSIPKLTRAKARELNRTPGIALPSLKESSAGATEMASLIKDDLHSDDDDEEYTFKEEDFISDDDPNTTASDMESNPRTPQTPLTQTEYEDSPVKFTPDGCFKLPLDKQNHGELEDMRIATRTRSKFCLQQTTIEDLQSEFIPPDVENIDVQDSDLGANDEEWMQFLNDFSKPLNNSFMGDDDDPVNDPEYIAAEKIPVDAEELRDINISKKELTELVAELFEGLVNEDISFETIQLETPQKFITNGIIDEKLETPTFQPIANKSPNKTPPSTGTELNAVTRQIDFDAPQQQLALVSNAYYVCDSTISSTNLTQNEYTFNPGIMSTPAMTNAINTTVIPIASLDHTTITPNTILLPDNAFNTEPELIAIPVPGQPNSFQLARIVARGGELTQQNISIQSPEKSQDNVPKDTRYTVPYDINYTCKYISIKRHIYSEYMQKFNDAYAVTTTTSTTTTTTALSAASTQSLTNTNAKGFTKEQHDLLQQQLRIHVQLLTQNYMQVYCHPDLWKYAQKPREMLMELKERAAQDASFNAWNLNPAVELITAYEQELSVDSVENREMMAFLNKEVERTSRNTRQVARLPPRIMELMLDSTVFMYPEYLPRIAFTLKKCSFHVFAPAESQIIALGLEKNMTFGRKGKKKKHVTLRRACDIISREMDRSKTGRRIWDHIKVLRNASYYNPVKYFFEHGRAPPTEYKIHTFPDNIVLPPRERVSELPLAWKKYLEEKQTTATQASSTSPNVTASEEARSSYLQLVKEVVGDEIQLPENFLLAAEPEQSVTSQVATPTSRKKKSTNKSKKEKREKQNVTINVNYVFGANAAASVLNNTGNSIIAPITPDRVQQTYGDANTSITTIDTLGNKLQTGNSHANISNSKNTSTDTQEPILYNFDLNTNTLQPIDQTLDEVESLKPKSSQKKLTDYFEIQETNNSKRFWEDLESTEKSNECPKRKRQQIHNKVKKNQKKFRRLNLTSFGIKRCHRNISLKYRQAKNLQKHYAKLFTNYSLSQQKQLLHFRHKPLVQFYYRNFKALELYTDLLIDLKMFCKNSTVNAAPIVVANINGTTATTTTNTSPSGASKRARQTDEEGGVRTKKVNRQEENFRNMLLPDSAEDANRKDAIYAFNFYEKVEEVLKASSRPEDCKRFNHILKTFDPKHDRVADLYYKLENLLMPDHPELAQVFLTFLLPSEAAEIGKFFEHFMAINMTTFINKLNIYFHKQPAQIRKVYNCLGELAEEEDVTMEKIESRIMPLLKGNQFLVDWFKQLFPESAPPERLLAPPENVNIKDVVNNQSGEFIETVVDTLDTPTQEPQKRHCQLRYINGRIFYGSKILLPAKLTFMAQSYQLDSMDEPSDELNTNDNCVHAIREHGEQRLIDALSAPTDCSSGDDNDKSEEEDASKALIIDTASEDESCVSTFEACDDATLHAHAVRLNPNCYGNTCYTNTTTSTPNPGSNTQQMHHPNAKKSSLNFYADDVKLSPRKQHLLSTIANSKNALSSATGITSSSNLSNAALAATSLASSAIANNSQREKRKSPVKKHTASSKSPNASANKQRATSQPMVVIHERNSNSAIACAKKLKSLIEDSSESEVDTKTNIAIVAKAKNKQVSNESHSEQYVKTENNDELEFLPENAEISMTLSQNSSSSPARKMIVDLTDEPQESVEQQHHVVSSTHNIDSDEDCKLDIVVSLATASEEEPCSSTSIASRTRVSTSQAHHAWTRDEDKIILLEMKLGSRNREDLFQRIKAKLPSRSLFEITGRHQFLLDFLSKLQGN